MFKISHETPICLLEESKNFCDYQYALVHLLEKDENYRNHFLNCKQQGIEIYLDNSLHELGYAMDNATLLKWVNILEPSNFFIPDVWQNYNASIVNAKEWSKIQLPKGVTKVAVIQAEEKSKVGLCYQTYRDLGYEKIAFSYGADYYNTMSSYPNKNIGKALGRVELISRLYDCDIILNSHKVHLLGTACPFEFSLYKDMSFIESIDTSNPIMATIDGIRYNTLGMHSKPKSNMNDNVYMDLKDIDKELLYHNIESFKNLTK
jgi:hypothetical protein